MVQNYHANEIPCMSEHGRKPRLSNLRHHYAIIFYFHDGVCDLALCEIAH